MSRSARASEQLQAALAGVLACAVVLLPLTDSGLSVTELAAVSLVVLALASALSVPHRVLLPRLVLGLLADGEAHALVVRTRKTDPMHHPLAPRAPGQA